MPRKGQAATMLRELAVLAATAVTLGVVVWLLAARGEPFL